MKRLSILLTLLLVSAQYAFAQGGRAQLVHAASDPSLNALDVYVDGVLFRDSITYRSATGYFDIGAGPHSISFALEGSVSPDEAFHEADVEITDGEAYSLFAVGFRDPEQFAPNPDGLDTGFRLVVADGARETSGVANRFDLRQVYFVPDMPTSDFLIGSVVDADVGYGAIRDFEIVQPGTWSCFLRSSGKSTSPYAEFWFDSGDLGGLGVLVVFSGQYYTGNGIDIEAFFVRPDGSIKPFEIRTETFRSQMVHASPDPVVQSVDVYLDGGPLFRNIPYPGARPFIDMPTGTHQIDVVPSGASVADGVLLSHRESASVGDSKHLMLVGFAEPETWGRNPDGLDTSLKFLVADDARETSDMAGRFYLRQVYTIPDMPSSDYVIGSWAGYGYRYGDIFETGGVDTGPFTGHLRSNGLATNPYAAMSFNSSGLEDLGILTVIGGRFYTGEGVDVNAFFVSPDGSITVHGNATSTFRAQMVHASPDPTVEAVDVYLDGGLLFRDLQYQEARAFIDMPVGMHQIDVVPFGVNLKDGIPLTHRGSSASADSVHVLLVGVLDTNQFPSNPDGLDTVFGLRFVDGARETMQEPLIGAYDMRLFNAVPDAPSVDFVGEIPSYPPEKIFSEIAYGSVSAYAGAVPNPTATGTVFGDLGTGSDEILLRTEVNSLGLGGNVTFVVLSGILDANRRASGNNDPDGLTLIGFSPTGEKVVGQRITALGNQPTETPEAFRLLGNYPNPFNPTTTISYDLPRTSDATLTIFDVLGKQIKEIASGTKAAGSYEVSFDATGIPSGIYFYRLQAGDYVETRRMVVVR